MVANDGDDRADSSERVESWMRRYEALLAHLDDVKAMPRESGADVARSESQLAGWVRYQRRRDVRGIMPAWQRSLLRAIPELLWSPSNDRWSHKFTLLLAFLLAQRRVPRYRSAIARERELAAWVHKQRHLHRRGLLRPDRVSALQRLPFKIL